MNTGFDAWNVDAGISAPPASARSTLRSVKLLIELPACSKNAQNSIEKNISTSATNSRSRSMRSLRNASNSRYASAAAPATARAMPAIRAVLHAQRDQRQRDRDAADHPRRPACRPPTREHGPRRAAIRRARARPRRCPPPPRARPATNPLTASW
jgi:hypothetical protein